MKYYLWHNKKKVYFDFNIAGFKQAQLYVMTHGLKQRRLYVEGSD